MLVGEDKTNSFVDSPGATLALPVAGGTQEEDPSFSFVAVPGCRIALQTWPNRLLTGTGRSDATSAGNGEIDQPRWALWSCSEAQTSMGRPKKGSLRAILTPGTRCKRTRDI
jgi:hypothetical protein